MARKLNTGIRTASPRAVWLERFNAATGRAHDRWDELDETASTPEQARALARRAGFRPVADGSSTRLDSGEGVGAERSIWVVRVIAPGAHAPLRWPGERKADHG